MRYDGLVQRFFRRRCHLLLLLVVMIFLMTRDQVSKLSKDVSFKSFRYPLDINMTALVRAYRAGKPLDKKPINNYQYKYTTDVSNKCKQSDIFLLFLVKSSVRHFDRRDSIRSTWGKEGPTSSTFQYKTIFLVGMPRENDDHRIHKTLQDEINRHNDVLQMTFRDDYYNNTQKTVGGIHWAVKHCGHAQFVVFMDDDFYVATPFLIAFLDPLSAKQHETLFMGNLHEDAPERNEYGKWFISYEDYPFNRYPPFISAGAMLISMHFLKDIQIAIPYTKNFLFDDVFLAIVVFKLGVYPQHNSNIYTGEKRIEHNSMLFHSVIASHGYYNDVLLQAAWQTHTMYVDALRRVLNPSRQRTSDNTGQTTHI
ncbi:beta-1,3-galactosyltransferase brn-like [Mizuhopecten yessoensis]|uniref:Hexosyltransferase n=1 Tax=Mizuhopecten yessoensis TaxID=6573 RepID=A0A210QKF5_MIZYE|nr:beta-1,3-galactosyltransferase brn-like [Mizuhopecten yessoensis]OWF49234.1 Beta-1,3-galactosyltransferase brn [Mizuhopecten yessoensis]